LADGSGGEERLTTGKYTQFASSSSADGQTLAFVETNSTTGYDIWVLPLQGERKPRALLQTPFNESYPAFSPDGRWLAYGSDESGRFEIYVQPFPGPGEKRQVSTDGGTEPFWGRNGRELFYRNGIKMMAVDVTTQPTLTFGNPRLLFERVSQTSNYRAHYDVTADGQRFLMTKQYQAGTEWTQINVVLNWFEELKRRVPAGR
jgi:Tol biopolymer transport system component